MMRFPAGQKKTRSQLVSSQLFKFAKDVIFPCTLMFFLVLPKYSLFGLNSRKTDKRGYIGKSYNPLLINNSFLSFDFSTWNCVMIQHAGKEKEPNVSFELSQVLG